MVSIRAYDQKQRTAHNPDLENRCRNLISRGQREPHARKQLADIINSITCNKDFGQRESEKKFVEESFRLIGRYPHSEYLELIKRNGMPKPIWRLLIKAPGINSEPQMQHPLAESVRKTACPETEAEQNLAVKLDERVTRPQEIKNASELVIKLVGLGEVLDSQYDPDTFSVDLTFKRDGCRAQEIIGLLKNAYGTSSKEMDKLCYPESDGYAWVGNAVIVSKDGISNHIIVPYVKFIDPTALTKKVDVTLGGISPLQFALCGLKTP